MAPVRLTLVALAGLGAALPAAAQDAPSLEALWEVIQQQQQEIDELKRQVGAAQAQIAGTDESIEATQEMVVATADYVETLEIPAAGGLGYHDRRLRRASLYPAGRGGSCP